MPIPVGPPWRAVLERGPWRPIPRWGCRVRRSDAAGWTFRIRRVRSARCARHGGTRQLTSRTACTAVGPAPKVRLTSVHCTSDRPPRALRRAAARRGLVIEHDPPVGEPHAPGRRRRRRRGCGWRPAPRCRRAARRDSRSSTRASVALSSSPVGSSASSTAGRVGQRDRQPGAGQLPAGQLAGVGGGPSARPSRPSRSADPRAVLRPARDRTSARLSAHGEVIEQVGGLEQHPDVPGPDAGRVRASGRWLIRCPAMRTLPPSGSSIPARQASSVDLPEPGGSGDRDELACARTVSDTPCSASVSSSPAR